VACDFGQRGIFRHLRYQFHDKRPVAHATNVIPVTTEGKSPEKLSFQWLASATRSRTQPRDWFRDSWLQGPCGFSILDWEISWPQKSARGAKIEPGEIFTTESPRHRVV
jgi:hypothetical protein